MALAAPIRSSTGTLPFDFERSRSMSTTPDSEGFKPTTRVVSSPPSTDSLLPDSAKRIPSNFGNVLSPSDLVGPSPVTSNGTETTEIEDDVSEEVQQAYEAESTSARQSELLLLSTNIPEAIRQTANEESVSVIHAPESFTSWTSTETTAKQSQASELGSPKAAKESTHPKPSPADRPPISTDVKPVRYSIDSATPRAQDLQDMMSDASRLRSSSTSSLEKIDEQTEAEGDDDNDEEDEPFPFQGPSSEKDKVDRLWTLFQNFWGVCQSLAGLGAFPSRDKLDHLASDSADAHERAWSSCWRLCTKLYNSTTGSAEGLTVLEMLELLRDFCQALFDIRARTDEYADSVLRVSFELNKHLYSAQDSRNLPEPFQERTLDFYITMCHRLMKQTHDEPNDTDILLRACWGLTEMLFNLRQNHREGQLPSEELLNLAIQACCELTDVFRSSWNQGMPERNTPRPTQMTFSQQTTENGRESRASNRSSIHSKRESTKSSSQKEERTRKPPPVPETPVTEFEDTPISPESRSPQMPNIMVLGPTSDGGRGGRWSSSASNLSNYSHSSNRTSSTATTTTATEDPNVTRSKLLVLKAAMNLGFNREGIADAKTGHATLQKFVQNLPTGAFGSLATHTTLLQQYKDAVKDGFMARSHTLVSRGKRASSHDVAKAVQSMISSSSSRYGYLRELYKFVFQFPLEEADSRKQITIQV